jgi:hypothetical protein
MEHHHVDSAARALLFALIKALDEHGVLSSEMIAAMITSMQREAANCRDAGDKVSAQQLSDTIGLLASYAAKRNAQPNLSADIHLKSFT